MRYHRPLVSHHDDVEIADQVALAGVHFLLMPPSGVPRHRRSGRNRWQKWSWLAERGKIAWSSHCIRHVFESFFVADTFRP
ncbi:MAG TPA: hypothetical protein DDZ51_06500 [Planctomycetaceae bacterium]|nr:hypothetical protein [Planctomycetaceae bacterium]